MRPARKLHNEAFGTVLARLRRARRWSQELLAFEADLTRTYVSLLERGWRSPTLDTLMVLSNALDTRLDDLTALVVAEIRRRSVEGEAPGRQRR